MKRRKFIIRVKEDDWTNRLAKEIISHNGNYEIPEAYLMRPVESLLEQVEVEEDDGE